MPKSRTITVTGKRKTKASNCMNTQQCVLFPSNVIKAGDRYISMLCLFPVAIHMFFSCCLVYTAIYTTVYAACTRPWTQPVHCRVHGSVVHGRTTLPCTWPAYMILYAASVHDRVYTVHTWPCTRVRCTPPCTTLPCTRQCTGRVHCLSLIHI